MEYYPTKQLQNIQKTKLKLGKQLEIKWILKNFPAEKASLIITDKITSLNNITVTDDKTGIKEYYKTLKNVQDLTS